MSVQKLNEEKVKEDAESKYLLRTMHFLHQNFVVEKLNPLAVFFFFNLFFLICDQ